MRELLLMSNASVVGYITVCNLQTTLINDVVPLQFVEATQSWKVLMNSQSAVTFNIHLLGTYYQYRII